MSSLTTLGPSMRASSRCVTPTATSCAGTCLAEGIRAQAEYESRRRPADACSPRFDFLAADSWRATACATRSYSAHCRAF